MLDKYVYIIVALLPIASLMLVFQSNPYQALVVRAILGAVAALVYATLGGADVALTEALVGTMLATTLYVIAVRSSLVMRLGVVDRQKIEQQDYFTEFSTQLRKAIDKYHLRLEIVDYANPQALEAALKAKEVHAICVERGFGDRPSEDKQLEPSLNTITRIHRLFEILQSELAHSSNTLEYLTANDLEAQH